MRPSFPSSLHPSAAGTDRSPVVAPRPPPVPWDAGAPSPSAALREAEATAWLLRVIVGVAAVLLAVEELVGAGPSAMHAALGLPAVALAGLALLELAAGVAVLVAGSRAGIRASAVVAAALSVALLAAGSTLALQTAFVAVCAVLLVRLDRLLTRQGLRRGGRAQTGPV